MPPLRLASCLICLALPALADPRDDAAKAAFVAGFTGGCDPGLLEEGAVLGPPQRFEVMMPQTYDAPVAATLWQFPCNMGAYNVTSVFYIEDEVWGLHPLSFAQPDFAVDHEVKDDSESPVKAIRTLGWTASPFLTNAEFDKGSLTLSSNGYWRGLGDASDIGEWQLVDGAFRLVRYEVDASYDGAVNPRPIYPAP